MPPFAEPTNKTSTLQLHSSYTIYPSFHA